jgi:hypothetical protein
MSIPLVLPQADHDLTDEIVGWLAHSVDANPPAVELIASIESGPRQTSAPSRGQTATSLALHMDARVALELYQRIGLLAQQMGWRLPPLDGGQDGMQKTVPTQPRRK